MNRVIIASPYGGDTDRNVRYAREAMTHSLELGEAPFAPHLLYPQVLDDTQQKQREQGMQAGFEWLQAADLIAFYVDYGWSPGMIQELKMARTLKRNGATRSLYLPKPETKEWPLEVRNLLAKAEIFP